MRPARLTVSTALIGAFASAIVALTSQERGTPRQVNVFLNDRYLLLAHPHLRANEAPARIDQLCVPFIEIERVLSGSRYLSRRGTNLDGVMLGAGPRAILRVQRRGRISARLHRSCDQVDIPLLDLVRALGATIVPIGSERITLVLESSNSDAILTLNDPRRRP
ncbi:MAG: hypothetical protein ACREMW_00860 [Gemmatimonadales bacterium]